ncbi:MAG: sensor histidine kinase [Firmicutes bacterium]|nr:sensor histidine kinase [Bacillota bacterium]
MAGPSFPAEQAQLRTPAASQPRRWQIPRIVKGITKPPAQEPPAHRAHEPADPAWAGALRSYIAARWGILSGLLALLWSLAWVARWPLGPRLPLISALLLGGGLANLCFWLWWRSGRRLKLLAGIQIWSEVLVVSALVWLSGGAASPLFAFYGLPVVLSAILLGSRSAWSVASGGALAFPVTAWLHGQPWTGGLFPWLGHAADAGLPLAAEAAGTGGGSGLAGMALVNAALLLGLAGLSGHLAELARRQRQALLQANRRLRQKEAARRQLLDRLVTAQEEERQRIARELHDETGQALSALILGLDLARQSLPDGAQSARQRLENLRSSAEQSLREIHQLIFDLRPSILDDLGLVPAVRWDMKNRLGPAGIQADFHCELGEQRLPPSVEVACFRIVQEALTNILKYAQATQVRVQLRSDGDALVLEIADNGVGFDPASLVAQRRRGGRCLGLLGIQERAALLGGKATIDSAPGRGTRLNVLLPLKGGAPGQPDAAACEEALLDEEDAGEP